MKTHNGAVVRLHRRDVVAYEDELTRFVAEKVRRHMLEKLRSSANVTENSIYMVETAEMHFEGLRGMMRAMRNAGGSVSPFNREEGFVAPHPRGEGAVMYIKTKAHHTGTGHLTTKTGINRFVGLLLHEFTHLLIPKEGHSEAFYGYLEELGCHVGKYIDDTYRKEDWSRQSIVTLEDVVNELDRIKETG